ncbi:MAG TPA: ATP-binding protein [Anaerolineales bacterium]|nr:ATP-binding protein [Anaerolineales bacterium]
MLPDYRVRQRDILLEIARAITQELDLPRLLDKILRYAVEMLGGKAGIIALCDPAGRAGGDPPAWRVAASFGLKPAFLHVLEPLLADLPALGDPQTVVLPALNDRLRKITRIATLGLLTALGLPMVAHDRAVGVVFVFRDFEGGFGTNERALLQSFADQAAIAVSNARAFSQVTEEKRRLDAILEGSAEGIAILGPDNHIQRFNRALQKLSGIAQDGATGRPHDQVLRFATVTTGKTLEQAEADGWPLSEQATLYVEGTLIRGDGRQLPVGVSYAPVFAPDRTLQNTVVSIRDLSRFREAEELKSTFISIISHELKTPVALIKGYASTLRREDAAWDPPTVADGLAVIEEEADRLAGLIEDLLDASRLQAGGLQLHMGEVQLATLASRLVDRFPKQEPQHTFRVDFPPDFPPVTGDEERLTQVLSNLLSNAIKYSSPGTAISIRGSFDPAQVVVTVSDQGPGISQEDLPHVFDRFYRAVDAARRTQGAGLGLFLARAVVEAHNGRIWADSRPGEGTSISFGLPRADYLHPLTDPL